MWKVTNVKAQTTMKAKGVLTKGVLANAALFGLVGKMYSKIQSCGRASGRNHRDTEDTKIDHYYIS